MIKISSSQQELNEQVDLDTSFLVSKQGCYFDDGNVIMPTISCLLRNPQDPSKFCQVFCLWDTGAKNTYVTKAFAEKLGLNQGNKVLSYVATFD